ncbi:MAG TPA: serine/threonine-protein kinase, partial [Aggregatilineales bacterium]|nr:serine/threonine-protein kinase [Aggregatilineales bacterium]
FRVAEKVYLDDATDIKPLVKLLVKPDRPVDDDVSTRIFEWTEGDLYLTQRVCERLDHRYPTGRITPESVDQVVERYLFEDDIFDGLGDKLKSHARVIEVVHDVVQRETSLRFTRTNRAITHAWLMGCLKSNSYGNCIARNSIYDHVLRDLLKTLSVQRNPVFIRPEEKKEALPLQGRYQLESVIKRGVLTHIYRARDLITGEFVVIKQLLSMRGGDIIAWRRFQREGEALRRLDHRNIVKYIDTFRESEYNYIVMEYVNGGTADGLLNREGRQSISLVLDIMLGVTDALQYAHEQQIVHRDLKPSNILLTQDHMPKLADFGVAHFSAGVERITATYAIVGTPAYLCPEGYDNAF